MYFNVNIFNISVLLLMTHKIRKGHLKQKEGSERMGQEIENDRIWHTLTKRVYPLTEFQFTLNVF